MQNRVHDLIKTVLVVDTLTEGSAIGPSNCPMCYQDVQWITANMDEIEHDPNCPYVIAKDLKRLMKLDLI